MAGARMAPTFAPELKMPVASERSLWGNHSAVVLRAAGKLPDSPRPREKRAMPNCEHGVGQSVAHGGEAPEGHDDHVADARAHLVNKAPGGEQADGISDHEGGHDVAVTGLRHADALHQRGLEDGDDLAVHVVDGRGDKEHGADGPSNAAETVAGIGRAVGLEGECHSISHFTLRSWRRALERLPIVTRAAKGSGSRLGVGAADAEGAGDALAFFDGEDAIDGGELDLLDLPLGQ